MSLTDLLKDTFDAPAEVYNRIDDYILRKIRPLTQWCDDKANGNNGVNLKYISSTFTFNKEKMDLSNFNIVSELKRFVPLIIDASSIGSSSFYFLPIYGLKSIISQYAQETKLNHTGLEEDNQNLIIVEPVFYFNNFLKHSRLALGILGTYILGDNLLDMTFGDSEFNYTALLKNLALIYHTSFTTYLMQGNDEPRRKKPLFDRTRQNLQNRIPFINPSYT